MTWNSIQPNKKIRIEVSPCVFLDEVFIFLGKKFKRDFAQP